MDVAAMSTMLSQGKLAQQVSLSVMKIAMDTAKGQALDLAQMLEANTKMMEQSIRPHIGRNIDVKL